MQPSNEFASGCRKRESSVAAKLRLSGLKKFVVKLDVSNPILIIVTSTVLPWVCCSLCGLRHPMAWGAYANRWVKVLIR